MKKNIKLNFMLMSGVLLFGMYSCTPGAQDYSSYVNPFIGTGGHLSVGCLFRILLCRFYYEWIFAYPS